MVFKAAIILACAAVLLAAFRAEAILKKILKTEEPMARQVLALKLAALAAAALLFAVVMIFGNTA